MASLTETTVSLSTIVSVSAPLVGAAITIATWVVKRMVGKLDKTLEDLDDELKELTGQCRAAEDQLRRECRECQALRVAERQDVIDVYGKFGARLARVETRVEDMMAAKGVCI